MQYEGVSIVATAHLDGPICVSTQEIQDKLASRFERLGLRQDLLFSVSGIRERRHWDEKTKPSEVASEAAKKVLAKADIAPGEIDVLVNASISRDHLSPSTANLVHRNLGVSPRCLFFDLTNACLGFLNGLNVVATMIQRKSARYGLVVVGEVTGNGVAATMERLLQPECDEATFRNNFATLTLGSGGAAFLLARSDVVPNGHTYQGGVNLSDTSYNRVCIAPHDNAMFTDTRALMKGGLGLMAKTLVKAKEELGWAEEDIDFYATHQVSQAHTDKAAELCGFDPEKIYRLYPTHGNIGPAGIAITLAKAESEGRIKKGDTVGLVGIGSGLNCALERIVW